MNFFNQFNTVWISIVIDPFPGRVAKTSSSTKGRVSSPGMFAERAHGLLDVLPGFRPQDRLAREKATSEGATEGLRARAVELEAANVCLESQMRREIEDACSR